jgi:hypothetical protein
LIIEYCAAIAEIRVDEAGSASVNPESTAGYRERLWISVKADELAVGRSRVKNFGRVTAAADREVEAGVAWLKFEPLDGFVEENRNMSGSVF